MKVMSSIIVELSTISKYILIKVVGVSRIKIIEMFNSSNCVLRLLFYHTIIVLLKGSHGKFAMFPWQPHILVCNVRTPIFTAQET